MKLFGFFSKKKNHTPFSQTVFNLLGFYPNDESLYEKALIHRSVTRNKKSGINNERLEFLGDSVLDLVVAEWLMEQYEDEQEGVLTQLRAKVVNRKNLNQCALKMGLNDLIKTDGKITLVNTSIPGNCLEAFIGAIYLDTDLIVAKKAVQQFIIAHLDPTVLIAKTTNFKSNLLEWSQQEKNHLEFIITELNEEDKKIFKAEVLVDKKSTATATGKSKKEASQLASQIALQELNIS